jgi:plastocyanin
MSLPLVRIAPTAAIVALSIVLAHVAAGGADPVPGASPSPGGPSPIASKPAMTGTTVTTFNFGYKPNPLVVAAGTTVTFKNADALAHTITAENDSDAPPLFDSGDMPPGATWAYTFTKAGTYHYFCKYHAYMRGAIVVK